MARNINDPIKPEDLQAWYDEAYDFRNAYDSNNIVPISQGGTNDTNLLRYFKNNANYEVLNQRFTDAHFYSTASNPTVFGITNWYQAQRFGRRVQVNGAIAIDATYNRGNSDFAIVRFPSLPIPQFTGIGSGAIYYPVAFYNNNLAKGSTAATTRLYSARLTYITSRLVTAFRIYQQGNPERSVLDSDLGSGSWFDFSFEYFVAR